MKSIKKINKVLIANRGEIALRVIRCCKDMGIKTVAIYSTVDKDALHVKMADEAICVGPAPAKESYLNQAAIITAAMMTNSDAIHPGFGFLSEREDFIQKVEGHGIIFIGPNSKLVAAMGDKIVAKKTAVEAGLPIIPGSDGAVDDLDAALDWAEEIGYPVMLKAAAGGGGKGMRPVYAKDEMAEKFAMVKAEAKNGFGDDTIYMEKLLTHPRHIEFQVLGDNHGNVVIAGERDCSVQRKNQKVMEEAPATGITEKERQHMIQVCTKAMKKLGYTCAGTLEFMYEDGEFYFLEMNTRIQVEHPVTEIVYGIDIVKEQIRISEGHPLSFTQKDLVPKGHAIEFRINAEDPETFVPAPGKLEVYHPAGGYGVRVDSAMYAGFSIPPTYDSMIAKLIVYGDNRDEVIARCRRALAEFKIEGPGVKTTIPLLQKILNEDAVINNKLDNHWLEKYLGWKK